MDSDLHLKLFAESLHQARVSEILEVLILPMFPYTIWQEIISIDHECEDGIEKSIPRITDWHHDSFSCSPLNTPFYIRKHEKTSRKILKPNGEDFLFHPQTSDRFSYSWFCHAFHHALANNFCLLVIAIGKVRHNLRIESSRRCS